MGEGVGAGSGDSQEEDADHEVRVRVAEGLPEELPLESFGEAGGVVLDGLDEPGPLRVGEECGILWILVGGLVGGHSTKVNRLYVHLASGRMQAGRQRWWLQIMSSRNVCDSGSAYQVLRVRTTNKLSV